MASGSVLMFCAPGLFYGGIEGVESRFQVLSSQTLFRRYGGRRVPFSCFVVSDSFSAVPRASGPVFIFCAPGLIFGGTEGFTSRFNVLRARTCFRRYRGRQVPFVCFLSLDSFLAVLRPSDPVFMFCASGLIFDGTEGVESRFQFLRAWTHFRRYRGRRVRFSYFACPDWFFGGTEGVGSRFHVLRAGTLFRRCRVRRVPFSCFARPFSFSAVSRAWGLVFMFCAPGFVFDDTERFGSRFDVLRAFDSFSTRFRLYRGRHIPFSCFVLPDSFSAVRSTSGPIFTFCSPGLVFGGTEDVGSHFHVLLSPTHFRRYRGRRVLFSSFARPDSFSAVTMASGPILMFCAPRLVFVGMEGVGSRFEVLRSRTRFRRCRVRRVPFSCFVLPVSFSAVPRASGSVFIFCAPGVVFSSTEGVGSRFHVLYTRSHFQQYRGRRVQFSCFAIPDSFSPVPRASGPVFMFCAPGLIFGIGSRCHILRARNRFRRYGGRLVPH
jgi:hypothetical protein